MSSESKDVMRARILGVDREVPCRVSPGMFLGEIAVQIESPDGQIVSGLFNEVYASWEGELNVDEVVKGRFGVRVIDEDEDTALIEFTANPGQHLVSGSPRARVPKSFFIPTELG